MPNRTITPYRYVCYSVIIRGIQVFSFLS
uniref:Uncharacterized protein n=1 Tax=Arundo donax TaxID=35708 RepID=A0A0A9BY11_ARUDO